jgi:hypothetical protein
VKKPRPASVTRSTPIDQALDQAVVHAQALVDLLEPHSPQFSVKDRNRRLKLPSNSAEAIAPLLNLAKENGLGPQAAPIEEHAGTLAILRGLRIGITHAQTLATDIEMRSETETWQATTLVYTMLRRLARTDGELEALLAPIVEKYFRKKKAPAPAAEEAGAPAETPATPAPKKRKKRRT